MPEVEQRALRSPMAVHFASKSLPDILECIAGWLRANPDVSVINIALDLTNDGLESAVVFYE